MDTVSRTLPSAGSLTLSLLVLLALGGGVERSKAQTTDPPRSNPVGIMLGAHLNGSALNLEDADEVESGGGAGFVLGYGFNRTVTVYVGVDGTILDSAAEEQDNAMLHADFGVRLHFGPEEKAALFYLDAAWSARVAQTDLLGPSVDLGGAAYTLGFGVEYFFSPGFALDLGAKFSFGEFQEISLEGAEEEIDQDGLTTRAIVGVSWYPRG
jgi:hypothetical protein